MRLALVLALLTLAACGPDADPGAAPPPRAPVAPPGPAFTVALDSLVADDPSVAYRATIRYPQIRGTSGQPMASALQAVNAAVRDSVAAFAASVRPEPGPPGAPLIPVVVGGGPTRAFVSDDVFSALVEVYVSTGGARAPVSFLALSFDLTTGGALAPADLFAPGTPWADTVAAVVGRDVRRRLGSEAAVFADGLDSIRQGRLDLTLGPDSLTVHVPPYQLSSEAAGAFHVGVPRAAVAAFVRPGGVLARQRGEAPAPPQRGSSGG